MELHDAEFSPCPLLLMNESDRLIRSSKRIIGLIFHYVIRPMCLIIPKEDSFPLSRKTWKFISLVVGFPSLKQQASRELNFQSLTVDGVITAAWVLVAAITESAVHELYQFDIHRWYETNPTSDSIGTEPWSPHPTLLIGLGAYFTGSFEMGRNSSCLALSPYGRSEVKVKFRPSPCEDHFTLIPRLNNSFCGEKGQDPSLLSKPSKGGLRSELVGVLRQ